MKRIFKTSAVLCLCAVLSFGCFAPKADAWGFTPTIEDLMEWFGITRTDRIMDMKDNILKAVRLAVELPKEFQSMNLTSILGVDSIKNMLNVENLWKDAQSQIEGLYKEDLSLWDRLTGTKGYTTAIDSILSKATSMTDSASSLNWDKYKKVPDIHLMAIKNPAPETQTYEAIKDLVNEKYGSNMTESLKEFDVSVFPGTGMSVYEGSLTMPHANTKQGMYKASAQYAQDLKMGRLNKIRELMTSADLTVTMIKKTMQTNRKKNMDALGESSTKFAGDLGAWKGTAAVWSAIAASNIDNQTMLNEVMDLMRIRMRLKAQVSSLALYDYVQNCYEEVSERRSVTNQISQTKH